MTSVSLANPEFIPSSQFPRFNELPTELRVKIWRAAVLQATIDRTIHLEVHT